MSKYVAFLRGINVGGKMVKMDKLQQTFKSHKFQNVKTILNSGNVIFETSEKNIMTLQNKVKASLKSAFGFDMEVFLCRDSEIKSLITSNPFKNIKIEPNTRLYVTFLSENKKPSIKIPFYSPKKDLRILSAKDSVVCSTVVLSEEKGTLDLMDLLEEEFGKKITTRNWNTLMKIENAL